MVLTILVFTLWIVLTLFFGRYCYKMGKKRENPISEEEQRIIDRERRELKNFWTYNGERQG